MDTRLLRKTACLLSLGLCALAAGAQQGAGWPQRPIKVIVPFAAGGATDLVARVVVQKMTEQFGQPMVIDNRKGAGGNIGVAAVVQAPPDGYTLLIGNVSTNALNPVMYGKSLKFDPLMQLQPVTEIASLENVLAATTAGTFPPNTMQEFIAYAHANPGKLNYSSAGFGTYAHLDMVVLAQRAKLDMVHVPNSGGAGSSTNVQAGFVQLGFLNAASALNDINAKLRKPLAVTGTRRLARLPDVPTLAELGFPGIGSANWAGLFAPAGTPPAIVKKLRDAVAAAVETEEVKRLFADNAIDAAVSASPQEFQKFVASENARFRRIVVENKVPLLTDSETR